MGIRLSYITFAGGEALAAGLSLARPAPADATGKRPANCENACRMAKPLVVKAISAALDFAGVGP